MAENNIDKSTNILCKIIGHNWRYKDYSNWIKNCGDVYPFKASRNCSRCHQNQYFYDKWTIENQKSPFDLERDAHAVKHLSHLHPD